MRIFIRLRNQNRMENDNRFSKHNYGLRKGYSIDEVILEQQLLYNTSKITMDPTMHVVTDLAAYYDRQLAEIEGIVLELTGVNSHAARLFAKVLLIMPYHICSGYGISNKTYESINNPVGRIGQENSFSGESYKSKSCQIIKEVETEELGIIVKSLIIEVEEQRSTLAFIDDTSFFGNGKECKEKVQMALNKYVKYYKVIRGKVE